MEELFGNVTANLYSPSFEYIHSKSDEPLDLGTLQTNLSSLVVIGQPLFSVPVLKKFKTLEDLWLVDCSIQNTHHVQHGKYLRNLHLSSNALTKIPNVINLRHLKVLWLPGNLIERIEENILPPTLEELNLADNRISTFGTSFQKCLCLETLNLSANPITSIFELFHLTKLQGLKHLWLCDPLYGMTPITKLVNYRSFVITCLPDLKQLDSHIIEEREIELSKLYFINKHKHYEMLKMDTAYNHYISQEEEYKNAMCELKKLRRNRYILTLNEEKARGKEDGDTLTLCRKLKSYINHQIEDWEKRRIKTEDELEMLRELTLRHIDIELQYFGNIKFKVHNKNSSIVGLCEKILNNFICPRIRNIISAIEVAVVTQVMRAGNTSLKGCPVLNDFTTLPISSSTFILCEPLYVEDSYEPFFNYIQQSLCFHKVDEVMYTISQCIGKADSSCFDVINGSINKNSGILKKRILSLVFIEEDDIVTEIQKEQEITSNDEDSGSSADECAVHKVLCHSVTNPLLLVEYYYIQKEEEDFNELTKEEIQLIEKELYLPSQSAVNSIFCHTTIWGNLVKVVATMLNLTAFGLTCPLPNVKELDVSYNKLSSLAEICHLFPNLEIMMATFNDIYVLPSVYELVYLKHLDLSWNSLKSLIEMLNWIKKSAPNIEMLNLKFNPFGDFNHSSHEIYLVLKILPNLSTYNSIKFEDQTFEKAKNVFTCNSIADFPVIKQSTDSLVPKYLEVFKLNEPIETYHDIRKTHVTVDSQYDITGLFFVKGEQFHDMNPKLSLKNVLSCTITNNKLYCAAFIKDMTNLMELNLSCNLLKSLGENLSALTNIVKLNLSNNYMKSIGNLSTLKLPNLKTLDISKNLLKDCIGIEGAINIEEINVSFNYISELDTFLFLKRLSKLRIIDIRKNGLEQMDILKRYLIYHVRTLEYINGSPLTESEIADAHNAFGGVLDIEYLEALNKNKDLNSLKQLNLTNSSLKMVSLKTTQLVNLISVNLENNTLETIAELLVLENLKFLSLAGNQISKFGEAQCGKIFKRLEELHLDRNSLVNLEPLELFKMPKLKTLFLQDNHITSLKGIEQLSSLHHLILDRNKINSIALHDVKKFINLKDLYLESNHLHKLDFLPSLKKIIRLFIKNNRIENLDTLRYLKYLTKIQELTFSGNPICRRFESYVNVLSYLPNINYVDGFLIESFSSIESLPLVVQ